MNESRKAFVIMPFDAEFDNIYADLIKSALEDAGYDVARADSFLNQQSILHEIVRGIASADLVVADLTTLNPNVLYELGLCHGMGIPTILLAQSMEEIPFDLRSYRILLYSTHFAEVHKLKQNLREIGEKHMLQQITFGSPIADYLPSRALSPRGAQEKEQAESEQEEKGILDFLTEGDEAIQEISRMFTQISEETESFTARVQGHTERLKAIAQNPELGTAAEAQRIASLIAGDLDKHSDSIEKNIPELESSIDVLAESYSHFVTSMEPESDEDRRIAVEFRKSTTGLLEATRAGLKSLTDYRTVAVGMRDRHISKEMNRATRRLAQTLDSFISAMERIEAFCVRTLLLIDERLGKSS